MAETVSRNRGGRPCKPTRFRVTAYLLSGGKKSAFFSVTTYADANAVMRALQALRDGDTKPEDTNW